MTEVQLATRDDCIYAAGLFDGEGSAVLTVKYVKHRRLAEKQYRSVVLVASISNTYLPVLLWVRERWGGYVTSLKRTRAQDRKPAFEWHTSSRNAAEVLNAIRPFVKIKHQQVENALAFQATKHYRGGKPTSDVEWQAAMSFLRLQRTLNGNPQADKDRISEAHGDQ